MALVTPSDVMDGCTGFMKCWADWAYTASDGFIFAGLLGAFLVVIYMSTIRFGNTRALGTAGVVGIFGSMFLSVMELMTWWVTSVFIILGVVLVASMRLSDT